MFEIFSDSSASTFWLLVKVFLNLGLVILLIYAALFVARRLKLGTFAQVNKRLAIIETLYLSPKQKIHLVRIGKKALLIGATDEQLSVLTDEVDVDLPETETVITQTGEQENPPTLAAAFKTNWERWLTSLNPQKNLLRHRTGE